MKFVAHKMVASLCEDMAQTCYEMLAGHPTMGNQFYAMNPDRDAFVKECAPTLRDQAIKIMAGWLVRNDIPEDKKMEIYDAIVLDKTIPRHALAS